MKNITFLIIAVLTVFVLTGCPEPESDSVSYELGDTGPAGGLIFYIDAANAFTWDYLEAAPASTESADVAWSSTSSLIGTGTSIGDGISNTSTVATWLDNNSESGRAAQLCRDLAEGNVGDWFLPSQDEFNLMYVNLHLQGLGDFDSGANPYWTSSEFGTTGSGAYFQYCSSGIQNPGGKSIATLLVRAARAF